MGTMWLDNQGSILYLKGSRLGNQMILQSDDLINKEGKSFIHSVTWTKNNDGIVRQYWEMITDGVISVVFDGLYKKTE